MEIINYTGKEYTKCKMQDQIFSQIDFPCEVQTKYIEDVGIEDFVQHGIMSIPTLVIKGTSTIMLTGNISEQDVKDAIAKVS